MLVGFVAVSIVGPQGARAQTRGSRIQGAAHYRSPFHREVVCERDMESRGGLRRRLGRRSLLAKALSIQLRRSAKLTAKSENG